MDFPWISILIPICLITEAFFSGSEISVVSADTMKLRHDANNGSKGAKLALKMLENPEWLLATTLVGTNIAVVTNTTVTTALMIDLFQTYGKWAAAAIAAPLIWVFGEIVPKSIFQQKADQLTPRVVYGLRFSSFIFYPILLVFTYLSRHITKAKTHSSRNPFILREEIILMLDTPAFEEGDIDSTEKEMIQRVFNFSETTASQAMTPLVDITAIERSTTCGEAMKTTTQYGHIRLPVYSERIDKIEGVVNTLDMLGAANDKPIENYINPVRFVPPNRSIKDLFTDMRQAEEYTAIVVDEFGGVEGLVSLEDIMEEVVEELEDEYDSSTGKDGSWIKKNGPRDYLVSARIEPEELVEKLDIQIDPGDHATLAGMLLDKLSEMPDQGTIVKIDNVRFTVQRCTPRAILEIRITW